MFSQVSDVANKPLVLSCLCFGLLHFSFLKIQRCPGGGGVVLFFWGVGGGWGGGGVFALMFLLFWQQCGYFFHMIVGFSIFHYTGIIMINVQTTLSKVAL